MLAGGCRWNLQLLWLVLKRGASATAKRAGVATAALGHVAQDHREPPARFGCLVAHVQRRSLRILGQGATTHATGKGQSACARQNGFLANRFEGKHRFVI
jgi:hypothetical protein